MHFPLTTHYEFSARIYQADKSHLDGVLKLFFHVSPVAFTDVITLQGRGRGHRLLAVPVADAVQGRKEPLSPLVRGEEGPGEPPEGLEPTHAHAHERDPLGEPPEVPSTIARAVA